ncbi:hypothetical protein [Streptomyces spectabilis]|uniref:Glycosyltransferase RgtA/B/C/D-like domain-containing protein n=1 Tax=Streptomyces spectabilis TaxID=68270 RepID=A0A7W8EX42_STRST|nr:hypothetical protein [Streptomyces spectabilis]MBB5108642.1 hypothetical protein [Streptomyces spectabilis]MCI3904443.1 hypothetical protein [Streptomyces spectabilis]GGV27240.1 hypothetical protein GCM10010245_44770 [Streptomyces spectabilis]
MALDLRKQEARRSARRDREQRAHRLLLAVCALFALTSLVLVPLGLRLGWDELVYASRFGPFAGPGAGVPFSAPRTRGVPLLLAPVATWSDSAVLLRAWLTLLASAALYLGFRPWVRAAPDRPEAAPVAAGLYGSLWIALFYANAAMPNHYTAMGATGAVGLFLHRRPTARTCAGVAGGLALATLMRPNDGAAVAGPLLLATALVPRWRSGARAAAALTGFAAGFLPWAVEAHVRFGGVRERLNAASEVQGGLRLTDSALHLFTVIDGPLLCRPCSGDGVRPIALEWWLLLAVLVPLGLWSVRGLRRTATGGLLAVAIGVSVALPYVLVVPYTAPRFLLPTHALLSVPAAFGVLAVVRAVRRRTRRRALAAGALVLVLAAHLTVQLTMVSSNHHIQESARRDWARVADVLHEQGVRAPCRLGGNTSVIPLAYAADCEPLPHGADRQPDALVMRSAPPPAWARSWTRVPVPDTYSSGWVVYVRP